MSLVLHCHPLSSFCQKVLIALYENGTPFEAKVLNFTDAAAAAEYRKLWPVGKIPLLQDTARGQTIPETSIIIEYLDRYYPGPTRLIPAAPDAAREVRLRDRIFDLYVNVPMQKVVTDRLRPAEKHDAFGVEEARGKLATACAMLDRDLKGRTWAAGESFSLADCAAAPPLFFVNLLQPFGDRYPTLSAYVARLRARPSIARALKEAEPFLAMMPK